MSAVILPCEGAWVIPGAVEGLVIFGVVVGVGTSGLGVVTTGVMTGAAVVTTRLMGPDLTVKVLVNTLPTKAF